MKSSPFAAIVLIASASAAAAAPADGTKCRRVFDYVAAGCYEKKLTCPTETEPCAITIEPRVCDLPRASVICGRKAK